MPPYQLIALDIFYFSNCLITQGHLSIASALDIFYFFFIILINYRFYWADFNYSRLLSYSYCIRYSLMLLLSDLLIIILRSRSAASMDNSILKWRSSVLIFNWQKKNWQVTIEQFISCTFFFQFGFNLIQIHYIVYFYDIYQIHSCVAPWQNFRCFIRGLSSACQLKENYSVLFSNIRSYITIVWISNNLMTNVYILYLIWIMWCTYILYSNSFSLITIHVFKSPICNK